MKLFVVEHNVDDKFTKFEGFKLWSDSVLSISKEPDAKYLGHVTVVDINSISEELREFISKEEKILIFQETIMLILEDVEDLARVIANAKAKKEESK